MLPGGGQADWVGTYSGTIDCGTTTEDVTLTIAAAGADQLSVSYATSNSTTSYNQPLSSISCELDLSSVANGDTLVIDAMLAGSEISWREIITGGLLDGERTITATRN